jgi:hypothetical protein
MSQVPNWFERKFEFSFPVELFPNLCARLRGTPTRIEHVVRGRPHEMLTRKAQAKWSVQEHAGHLLETSNRYGWREWTITWRPATNSPRQTRRIEKPTKRTTMRVQ